MQTAPTPIPISAGSPSPNSTPSSSSSTPAPLPLADELVFASKPPARFVAPVAAAVRPGVAGVESAVGMGAEFKAPGRGEVALALQTVSVTGVLLAKTRVPTGHDWLGLHAPLLVSFCQVPFAHTAHVRSAAGDGCVAMYVPAGHTRHAVQLVFSEGQAAGWNWPVAHAWQPPVRVIGWVPLATTWPAAHRRVGNCAAPGQARHVNDGRFSSHCPSWYSVAPHVALVQLAHVPFASAEAPLRYCIRPQAWWSLHVFHVPALS